MYSKDIFVLANKINHKLVKYTAIVLGIGILSYFLSFIKTLTKLGASGSNSQKRAVAINEFLNKGLLFSLIGGFPVIISILINMVIK